jgi:hypothetical protein
MTSRLTSARTEPCHVVVREGEGAPLRLQARCTRSAAGAQAAVVAPPHPLYGGTLDNPVVTNALQALARANHVTLAFNWRGVEQSEGRATEELAAAVADYRAALEHALTLGAAPAVCAGYSFGAGTALLAARDDARVSSLVLVAPPVGMLRAEDLVAFAGRVLVVVGDDDEYAPLSELQAILAARADLTLEVIRGADHFFHYGGLTEIEPRIAAFLAAS